MKLRKKQALFMKLLPMLLQYADVLTARTGILHEFTAGDLYRAKTCSHGHKDSNHRKRLAIDLNLFLDGKYQTSTKAHQELGEFWESLHPLCCWGGRFSNPDGNHYSLKHKGVK